MSGPGAVLDRLQAVLGAAGLRVAVDGDSPLVPTGVLLTWPTEQFGESRTLCPMRSAWDVEVLLVVSAPAEGTFRAEVDRVYGLVKAALQSAWPDASWESAEASTISIANTNFPGYRISGRVHH